MKKAGSRQQAVGIRRKMKIFFTVACCLMPVAFSSVGCGKKGDPRAPELATPETIRDLRAQALDGGIALTWSRPMRYVDGKELRDLAGFVIFRKEISKSCPDCPVPFRERAKLNVEDQEKFIKKKQFRFMDQELEPGTAYRYRVFSRLMDDSLSDPSNEAGATWNP